MSDGKLNYWSVDDYSDDYVIAWEFDGDMGGVLGDDVYTLADLAAAARKADDGQWGHIKATLAAARTEGVERRGIRTHGTVYVWPSKTLVVAALRAIKAALKDRSDRPWPEWAIKAKGAGWTPPKGWQP